MTWSLGLGGEMVGDTMGAHKWLGTRSWIKTRDGGMRRCWYIDLVSRLGKE